MKMADPTHSLHYRSYLLRFWEERPQLRDPPSGDAQPIGLWRFSLEDPHTGQRLGFADFDQLTAFLIEQMNHHQ